MEKKSETENFAAGDIVNLKSGGLDMTCDARRDGERIVCSWFDYSGSLCHCSFLPEMLVKKS